MLPACQPVPANPPPISHTKVYHLTKCNLLVNSRHNFVLMVAGGCGCGALRLRAVFIGCFNENQACVPAYRTAQAQAQAQPCRDLAIVTSMYKVQAARVEGISEPLRHRNGLSLCTFVFQFHTVHTSYTHAILRTHTTASSPSSTSEPTTPRRHHNFTSILSQFKQQK